MPLCHSAAPADAATSARRGEGNYAKVVSAQSDNKYAGQNSMFALFCYKSAELQDVLLEPWFIDGLSMHAKENAKKKYTKMLHDYESRGQ
jgi:hypothetical protein